MNARRRHDILLRRYLATSRERAEAQIGGTSPSHVERLAARERALASALRTIRLYLGLPETFDPELESARLGIAGKRPGRAANTRASTDRREHLKTRVKLVPSATSTARRSVEHPRCVDSTELAVTVSELLAFVESHQVDPDSEIVVRRLSGSHGNVERDLVNVACISLTDDGRLQLDVH